MAYSFVNNLHIVFLWLFNVILMFNNTEQLGIFEQNIWSCRIRSLEIWKYPPLGSSGYVDKLSLYLTLKDEHDPRVEKEIEIMMNDIKW